MKIFAGYKPTQQPWGGANNFLRALYHTLEKNHGVQVVFDPAPDCDIFFFGQTGKGPANDSAQFSHTELKNIIALNKRAPAIMRMVNLRRHSSHKYLLTYWLNHTDRMLDTHTGETAALCDHIIFQSAYQKSFFNAQGIKPENYSVIHNGAASMFSGYNGPIEKLAEGQKLKIAASSVSTKASKNHTLIAHIAGLDDVEVSYAGVWPDGLSSGNVRLLGKIDHAAILEVLKTSHYFLHPGVKEACSNSIIEALAMGLPVLYGAGKGSSAEIVGSHGMVVITDNLKTQLQKARLQQPDFVEALSLERARYSMESTAAAYYAAFTDAIRRKKEAA